MTDARARCGCGQRRAAGIGKEIQNADRTPGAADGAIDKVPVGRLLREYTRVLEIHGLDIEGQLTIVNLPALGQAVVRPVPAARGRAGIARVKLTPAAVILGGEPDDLRVGTHEEIFSPAFELFPVGGVEHLIILPLIGFPHRSDPQCHGRMGDGPIGSVGSVGSVGLVLSLVCTWQTCSSSSGL